MTADRRASAAPPAELADQRILCVVMHRADLHAALLAGVGAEHVRLGAGCIGVDQDAFGVTARFADGRSARGDLLVGADGLHSVVRAGLHGQHAPAYSGYTAWRAAVRYDVRQVRASESWGAGQRFGQVSMSGGRVYWYATQNVPEGQRNVNEKVAVLKLFRGWHQPIEALIQATGESALLRNDIYDRAVLKRWGAGRVTLLGDAAHPMTPNLGQGACQALEDAAVLGQCLAGAGDPASALRAYESRRAPRANALVIQSRRVGQIAQWQNRVAVGMRDAIFRRISPRMQARWLERTVGYRV